MFILTISKATSLIACLCCCLSLGLAGIVISCVGMLFSFFNYPLFSPFVLHSLAYQLFPYWLSAPCIYSLFFPKISAKSRFDQQIVEELKFYFGLFFPDSIQIVIFQSISKPQISTIDKISFIPFYSFHGILIIMYERDWQPAGQTRKSLL